MYLLLTYHSTCDIMSSSNEREVIIMNRKAMMDEMINRHGFENRWIIWLAGLIESPLVTDKQAHDYVVFAESRIRIDRERAEEEEL